MDIEKTMVIAAPIDRVWSVLLDPNIMAGCVPGVQSVQVLSDTEYLSDIKVKISFISHTSRSRRQSSKPSRHTVCGAKASARIPRLPVR